MPIFVNMFEWSLFSDIERTYRSILLVHMPRPHILLFLRDLLPITSHVSEML
jgi:hypothetical protein